MSVLNPKGFGTLPKNIVHVVNSCGASSKLNGFEISCIVPFDSVDSCNVLAFEGVVHVVKTQVDSFNFHTRRDRHACPKFTVPSSLNAEFPRDSLYVHVATQ